jgi:hypothetical protein
MRTIPHLIILIAVAFPETIAQEAKETPVTALLDYRTALKKGDLEGAMALTASFTRLPTERVRELTKEYLDMTASGRLHIWLYPDSLRIIADCAVIVTGDGARPAPDDPCYLLNQNGKWKVLPALTKWQEDYFDLTADQKQAFGTLAEHHKREKKRLREKGNSGADAK